MIEASIDTITITADIGKGYPVRGDKGENAYVHLAYANSTDGKDFTLTPEEGKTYEYLGQYTDNTETASTEWSAYKWSWLTDEASRQAAETARTAAAAAVIDRAGEVTKAAEEATEKAESAAEQAESATNDALEAAKGIAFMTFDIDSDGYLNLNNPYSNFSFEVTDGYLEVVS